MNPMTRRQMMAVLAAAAPGAAAPAVRPKVIDAHNHLNYHSRPDWAEQDRKLIDAADRLHIDQLCCSILPPERPTSLEGYKNCNKWLAEAIKQYPGRVLGYVFVNPAYGQDALDEIRRYVGDHGFIGVKLYNDVLVTDPRMVPLLELAGKLKIPILHHSGHCTWLPSPQPLISDAGRIAEAARNFPDTTFICAHICGGGDWEWSIKALRDARTVFFDTSGSVADEGTVEMAVRILGADRVLFACDMSMSVSVARVRGADLSETDRRKLFGENMQRILARRRA
jgi:uncharacterized protein